MNLSIIISPIIIFSNADLSCLFYQTQVGPSHCDHKPMSNGEIIVVLNNNVIGIIQTIKYNCMYIIYHIVL